MQDQNTPPTNTETRRLAYLIDNMIVYIDDLWDTAVQAEKGTPWKLAGEFGSGS